MQDNVYTVINNIKEVCNPAIKANRLLLYLNDLLKKQEITIYEAYLLQGQIINYMRDWYKQPAWGGWVQISTCLEIMNQRLLAVAFKDVDYAKTLKEWGSEAFRLCEEKRTHYIIDRFEEFINVDENANALLQGLLDVRKKYARLSAGEGPYHVESFPFHYFEPEKILLEKMDMANEKNISKDVETILVELSI